MSAVFRIILILASIATCFYISRKLKRAQVDTHDTGFWLLFSFILILISIFPQIADWLAAQLGIYSTVNMVFLIIIFRCFYECSSLLSRLRNWNISSVSWWRNWRSGKRRTLRVKNRIPKNKERTYAGL